ncbi:MAG: hypothetical protein ACK5LP_06590 [Campylobacteraceae bacterium]
MIKTSMSIRELTRSGDELSRYDFIDIEDKKQKIYKGIFVPKEHAKKVKEFLLKLLEKEKKQKKEEILKFSAILSGESENKKIQDIKSTKK